MAAVEIFFHRVLTDDRWMNQAACKGLTHLFFPPPAERPQARDRREAAAKSVCASCIVHSCLPGVRPDEPRVRVLGWRERGRAPRRRLPPDRPDRRASPQRRLSQRLRSPHERRRPPTARPSTRPGPPTATPARSAASTRSAPTSRPTGSTACTSTTARRSSARCRRTARTSCSSRITSGSTDAPALLATTRFAGMLADVWSRDGRIFTWYDQQCGRCSTTTCPARDALPRVLSAETDRQPGDARWPSSIWPAPTSRRCSPAPRRRSRATRSTCSTCWRARSRRATSICRRRRSACCGSTRTGSSNGWSRSATTSGRRSRC